MRWIVISFIFLSTLFLWSGCFSVFQPDAEQKAAQTGIKLLETHNSIDERTKQLNSAANDLLENIPEEERKPEAEIARLFTEENERILGQPIESLSIEAILKEYLNDKKDWEKTWAKLGAENTELLKNKENLEIQLKYWQEESVRQSQKSWWEKFWEWFWDLGLWGMIILGLTILFFPAIGVPILTYIVSLLIKAVPALISIFGVVARSAYDQTIVGIQRTKNEIRYAKLQKRMYDDAEKYRYTNVINQGGVLYTPEEVEMILERNLKATHDSSTGKIIKERKKVLKQKFQI